MPLPPPRFQGVIPSGPDGKPKTSLNPSAFATPVQPRTPTRFISAFAQTPAPKRKREDVELKALPSPMGFSVTTPIKREVDRQRSVTPLRKVSEMTFEPLPSKRQKPLSVPSIKVEVKQEEVVRPMAAVTSLPAHAIRDPIEDAGFAERGEADLWVTPSKKGIPGRRTTRPPLSYLLTRALTPYTASLNLFYQSLSSIVRSTPPLTHIRSASLHLRLELNADALTFHAKSLNGAQEYQLLLQPLPRGCVLSGADPAVIKVRGQGCYEIGIWAEWGEVAGVLVCSRYLIAAA